MLVYWIDYYPKLNIWFFPLNSPDYGDEEETEQDDAKMLLDEDEARMR